MRLCHVTIPETNTGVNGRIVTGPRRLDWSTMWPAGSRVLRSVSSTLTHESHRTTCSCPALDFKLVAKTDYDPSDDETTRTEQGRLIIPRAQKYRGEIFFDDFLF